jgi:WD40 repeat protein
MRYKAFISYSHAVDNLLAPRLQMALQAFAKPFFRARAIRVFRDTTSLAATPQLWPDIQAALHDSEFFILLASPAAAKSAWVNREVDEWFASGRSTDTLLLVLTEGSVVWSADTSDFDWSLTTALPPSLRDRSATEPLYVDLRGARAEADLSLRHPAFIDAVATLLAQLKGVPKDQLIGEDIVQQRRVRRITIAVGTVLLLLTAGSLKLAGVAMSEARVARSRELAARATAALGTNPVEAGDLALAAVRAHPTTEAVTTLREALLASPVSSVFRSKFGEPQPGSLAFSPDGRLVFASTESEFTAWNSETGARLVTLTSFGSFIPPSFSSDGAWAAIQTLGAVQVRDLHGWRLAAEFPAPHGIDAFAAFGGPADRLVITASPFDSVADLWDRITRNHLKTYTGYLSTEALIADSGRVVLMADIGGPNRAVTLRGDHVGRIRALDTASGQARFTRPARVPGLQRGGISLSFDGEWGASLDPDARVTVWDVRTGTVRAVFGNDVHSAEFAPRDLRLLTTNGTSVIQVWDPLRGRTLRTLTAPLGGIHDAVFSPDGSRIVARTYEGRSYVWNATDGSLVGTVFGRSTSPYDMDPSGSRFLIPYGAVVRVVEPVAQSLRTVRVLRSDSEALPGELIWSPGNDRLAVLRGSEVEVWDVATARRTDVLRGHRGEVVSFAFNPRNPDEMVTSSRDSTVRLWRFGRGVEGIPHRLPDLSWGAEFSADGQRVLSRTYAGATLLDHTLTEIRHWATRDTTPLAAVFAANGSAAVSFSVLEDGDYRQVTELRDLDTDHVRLRLNTGVHSMNAGGTRILGSPQLSDGEFLYMGLQLYDGTTGRAIGFRRSWLRGRRPEQADAATFSVSGRLVATAGSVDDYRVRIWNAATGRLLTTLQGEFINVRDLQFGMRDRLLLLHEGPDNDVVSFWDVRTGQRAGALRVPGGIDHAAFSPSGRMVALSCMDNTVRVYRWQLFAAPSDLLAAARARWEGAR